MTNPNYYYVGKRMHNGKLAHTVIQEGTKYFFTKAKDSWFMAAKIGNEYNLGENTRIPDMWNEVDTGNVHPDAKAWEAEQRAAMQEKKYLTYSSTPNMDMYVKALRNSTKNMSKVERALFAGYIIGEIMK